MVGVPGRSKGCSTCRRRKKGCDKKVPFCGQCLALDIQCEGYERQPIWVNSKGNRQTAYTKPSSNSLPELSRSPESDPEPPTAVTLHDSFTRTARTQKYTGLFWADYLSGENGFSHKAFGTKKTQWLRVHEELCRTEATLQFMAMALSTATLGASNDDEDLKVKSLQAYGLAIKQLATSLKERGPNNDGVLAAVQLMRIFELLFGADPGSHDAGGPASQIQSFRRHVDGETALILSRGPNDTWSPSGRQLLADGRLHLITAYISRRRRSPFSQPEWKHAHSWRSVADSPLNKLLDTLVEIPGLLEDLDTLRRVSTSKESEQLHTSLVAKCQACELALLAWEVEMGDLLGMYDYTTTSETIPIPQNDDDLALLYLSHIYWMTCLMLYSTMGFCELENPRTRGHSTDLTTSVAQQMARTYAYRIAHSIYLLFRPPAGTYSAAAALFPLGQALRYLIMLETYGGQNILSNERLMLVQVFKQPFLGSIVGRFLRNLQSDDGINYGVEGIVGMRAVEYRARVWWCGLDRAGLPELIFDDPCLK